MYLYLELSAADPPAPAGLGGDGLLQVSVPGHARQQGRKFSEVVEVQGVEPGVLVLVLDSRRHVRVLSPAGPHPGVGAGEPRKLAPHV